MPKFDLIFIDKLFWRKCGANREGEKPKETKEGMGWTPTTGRSNLTKRKEDWGEKF